MILKVIEYKILEDEDFDPTTINETNILSELNISDDNYESITVTIVSGKPYIEIIGKNKWASFTALGNFNNMIVNDSSSQNTAITYLYNEGEHQDQWIAGYKDGTSTISKEADHLLISAEFGDTTGVTNEMIDLTDINKIWVDWIHTGVGSTFTNGRYITITSNSDGFSSPIAQISLTDNYNNQIEQFLDVESYIGNYYIGITLNAHMMFENHQELKIYNIWLE